MKGTVQWINSSLTSRKFILWTLAVLAAVSVPDSLVEIKRVYSLPVYAAAYALLCLSLILCTLKNLRKSHFSVSMIHAGFAVVIAGAFLSSLGYVATTNMYEGTTAENVFRWDTGEDFALDAKLQVKKIAMEYYPVAVKVGVMESGLRKALYMTATGVNFKQGAYTIRVDSLEFPEKELMLSVFDSTGKRMGTAGTGDMSSRGYMPPGFPYEFFLVAYKNPVPKRVWAELALRRGGHTLAEGISEANKPFRWKGLRFYLIHVETDAFGTPYAGIQVTQDPGRPCVFSGFGVIVAGMSIYLLRRIRGNR